MCFVWVSNSASTCASWHSYVCSQVNSAEAVIRHKNHAEYKSCLLWRNFVKGVKIRTGSQTMNTFWLHYGTFLVYGQLKVLSKHDHPFTDAVMAEGAMEVPPGQQCLLSKALMLIPSSPKHTLVSSIRSNAQGHFDWTDGARNQTATLYF